MIQKVFGYIRVSTANQAREGYSLGYQEEEMAQEVLQNYRTEHIWDEYN